MQIEVKSGIKNIMFILGQQNSMHIELLFVYLINKISCQTDLSYLIKL